MPRHRRECHGALLAEPRRQVGEHRGVGTHLQRHRVEYVRELPDLQAIFHLAGVHQEVVQLLESKRLEKLYAYSGSSLHRFE